MITVNSISLVTKLLDDDAELADKYADTNANPYADQIAMHNNEAENINTKTVKRGDKYGLPSMAWIQLNLMQANKDNIQTVGITDDYDEAKLEVNATQTLRLTIQ